MRRAIAGGAGGGDEAGCSAAADGCSGGAECEAGVAEKREWRAAPPRAAAPPLTAAAVAKNAKLALQKREWREKKKRAFEELIQDFIYLYLSKI